jgi:hypothetical protein
MVEFAVLVFVMLERVYAVSNPWAFGASLVIANDRLFAGQSL